MPRGIKRLAAFNGALFLLTTALGFGAFLILPAGMAGILCPALATILVFFAFTLILKRRVSHNLLGEIGFLYLAFALVYTLIPASIFLLIDSELETWKSVADLLAASSSELGVHLWRHVLFMAGVSAGYLLVRGHGMPRVAEAIDYDEKDGTTIVFLLGMAAICILSLSLLSAPVESYIDNYVRYDHLAWLPRKYVSLCVRLKLGIYVVLLAFLFRSYGKFRPIIPIVVASICAYELTFSFGARIESLMIMLMVVCLYSYLVKAITLTKAVIAFSVLAVFFSAIELFRSYGFDLGSTKDAVAGQGVGPAIEFGAVYLTGFHLYAERAQGTMAPTEWPMFFYDFISPFTFNDFTDWNPQYWYARNYFPDAIVPPFTLGPIADSAIWGGEADLLVRSLVSGMFFAGVMRWFLRNRTKWWAVSIYVYFYATCVITLKYSVFYQLTPLVKTLLPTLLIVGGIRKLIPGKRGKGRAMEHLLPGQSAQITRGPGCTGST